MGSWKAVNYKMPCLDPPFHMTRKYFFGGQAAWKNECKTSVALDARHFQIWRDLTYLSAMPHWSLWCVETNSLWWVIRWMFSKNRTHLLKLWSKCTDHQNIWRDRWPEQMWGMICKIRENEWMVDGNGWLMDLTSSDKIKTFEPEFVSEVKKRKRYRDSKELQYLATVFVLGWILCGYSMSIEHTLHTLSSLKRDIEYSCRHHTDRPLAVSKRRAAVMEDALAA